MSWLARLLRRTSHAEGDGRADLVAGIARTRARRREVAAQVGGAFARLRTVEQQLTHQRMRLVRARSEIVTAVARAERAAGASSDDPGAAALYADTADALRTQQAVLDAAIAQLDAARSDARASVLRSQELLGRSRAILDTALRDQVRLLARLDALHQRLPPDSPG